MGNTLAYFRENYRTHHDFLEMNKAMKQIEQAVVLSSEEQSLIDWLWSLILVKSNQFAVEGFDLKINYTLCFHVTS